MLNDIFGWSPDIGRFVTRNEKTYTEYGCIYDQSAIFRSMISNHASEENYADWSTEKREQALVQTEEKIKLQKDKEETEKKYRIKLIESAKMKLTEAEFNAILTVGYNNESID